MVALRPDGRLAFTTSLDGSVRLWDVSGEQSARRFICIMSSKVMGRFALWAIAEGTRKEARVQQRRSLEGFIRGPPARWRGAALREEQVYTG